MESEINQVKEQIDAIVWASWPIAVEPWLDSDNYQLGSTSPKNKKSRYGLIHDILHYGDEGERIIDSIDEKNLQQLYDNCMLHMANHPTNDFPGGGPLRGGWTRQKC